MITEHINDFNWILVYGVEAHPTLGECPSNCPPGIYNDTTVVQHETYLYRRYATGDLQNSPEHVFPFPIYADNPNNAVYNNFFQRPFGLCAVNCNGVVELRADWSYNYIAENYEQVVALIDTVAPCSEDPIDDEENPDGEITGVPEVDGAFQVAAWPNPAVDAVRLRIPAHFGNATRIRLIDGVGRVVLDQSSAAGEQTINLRNLSKGMLYLEVTGNGFNERLRLMHH